MPSAVAPFDALTCSFFYAPALSYLHPHLSVPASS
jgi:hypothetical protein